MITDRVGGRPPPRFREAMLADESDATCEPSFTFRFVTISRQGPSDCPITASRSSVLRLAGAYRLEEIGRSRYVTTVDRLPKNRSVPSSTVIPVLSYPDVRQAVKWLEDVFGFRERLQIADHRAQLVIGDGAMIVAEYMIVSVAAGRRGLRQPPGHGPDFGRVRRLRARPRLRRGDSAALRSITSTASGRTPSGTSAATGGPPPRLADSDPGDWAARACSEGVTCRTGVPAGPRGPREVASIGSASAQSADPWARCGRRGTFDNET